MASALDDSYVRGGVDVVLPPPPRQFDDQGLDQTYLQNQAEDRERALPRPIDNTKYRFPSDDLSQGDIVVGLNLNPHGEKDIQSGVWTGGAPARFDYPTSRYTNPFSTPEYGTQSSPTNPVLSDAPPEIPPGYSETRGFSSQYRAPGTEPYIPPEPEPRGPQGPYRSAIIKASYAGDVLSPYASGNARLGELSSVEGVREDMARKFHTMVEAMPPEVKARVDIISGRRDAARQHQVNPGVKDSRHMHGMALDLAGDPVVLDWIGQNPQFGLGFPLRSMGPKEYNHLEMIDPKTGARMAVTDEHLHGQTGSSTPPPPQQPTPAAGTDQPTKKPQHPIEIFEDAVKEFPIIHSQGLTAGPGNSTEYWPAGEPGTQARPRPSFIPIDQAGMEIGPDAKPLDVLGDVVSHHMVKTDPVIKKTYEDFANSLTDTQKELLQAQYMYYRKNEGETRPYDQWEKTSGLPAYFRGYAFQQWPQDFNKSAYTPQQRYHFDQMMGYLRTGRSQATASLQ